jgi:hypothetical protein
MTKKGGLMNSSGVGSKRFLKWYAVVFVFLFCIFLQTEVHAFTLKVKDKEGNPVNGFRWLVEEDTTNVVSPGVFSSRTLGVNIHGTYAPVKLKGRSDTNTAVIDVSPNKRWFVSVLPDAAADGSPRFTANGHVVEKGAENVKVVVNALPIPTAQISVYAFLDNAPINNGPDIGENGLGDFSILVFDQLGQVSQDAFGNPLGTEYNLSDGSVKTLGNGEIITCVQAEVEAWKAWQENPVGDAPRECNLVGEALIRNLVPGKYGVRAVPPQEQTTWVQTSTIEGTPGVDAWVKSNEPRQLIEFGPGMWHVFLGFVQPFDNLQMLRDECAARPPVCVQIDPPPAPPVCTPVSCTESTVTGDVRRVHSGINQLSVFPGTFVEECFIGLNVLEGGANVGVYIAPCDANSAFTINGLPPGTYQLVAWDKPLDYIFYFSSFIVDGLGTPVDLTNQIFMNSWFGNLEGSVFYDTNQNGFRDPGEVGIDSQNLNLRFRDGSIYQATPTDINGEYAFNEVFPFFKYLVVEVDFLRFKATGATLTVDKGGPVDIGVLEGKLSPQPQTCTQADIDAGTIADYGTDQTAGTGDDALCIAIGQPIIHPFTADNLSRLEQGVVLLEAQTLYADQTNIIDWGKVDYAPGENGGISGVAVYATTRAEDDPALAATDPWEPGVPRVQVNLYADWNNDFKIDSMNGNTTVELADVDNHPFGNFPGPEDIDRDGNGLFNRGDALNVVTSDSWDDNLPTGCQPCDTADPGCFGTTQFVFGQPIRDCAETLQTWNQLRPAVFDGGWAFDAYYPFGKGLFGNPDAEIPLPGNVHYIVEVVPPPGFKVVREEDRNVDFGDAYTPSPLLLPPPCVGTPANKQPVHEVPDFLVLFPEAQIPAFRAGETTPLCNMKQVFLEDMQNAATDFHIFTEVPKTARGVGLINNDVAITLDPNNPVIGEKAGVVWLPMSIQDFAGNEVTRIYTDQFGAYNFIAPGTYTVNAAIPTGVSPNMLRLCLNDPGPIPDPNNPGNLITDPFFDTRFSLTCYTFDFWPGKTTYLDTPVIPVSAFTAVFDATLDCEFPDGTPVLSDVTGAGGLGPYVRSAATQSRKLTILSAGNVQVPNPDCNSRFDPACAPLITRDYGFGSTQGTVKIGDIELTDVVWTDKTITGRVPAGTADGAYQLSVARGDNGKSTVTGITVAVGGPDPTVVLPDQSIQAAIDAANPGDLIIVRPGRYNENIIMDKNVRIQGSSAFSTIIKAAPTLPENLQEFTQELQARIDADEAALVPGENITQHIEYAALTVVPTEGEFTAPPNNARIDGFTLISATSGGGITVNGFAHYLDIGNNRIINNAGSFGGGIRVGTPGLIDTTGTDPSCGPDSTTYCSSRNDNIRIHNNQILQNGGVAATTGGGGISLYNGSDAYQITDNYICGNFTTSRGGGISHVGLSDGGLIPNLISNNKILLNESNFQSITGGEGGGILIKGEPARVDPATGLPVPPGLTPGTGSVKIISNLIQANIGGNGKGGGIFVSFANGIDVDASPGDNTTWYGIDILNNIIVNNIAGWVGGGIYLEDAAKVNVVHNTIANNSSTAVGANALLGAGLGQPTDPQAAGVVSGVHSGGLAAVSGQNFSNPLLQNNIIWHNSSFGYDPTANNGLGGLVPHPSTYWDLGVFESALEADPVPVAAVLNPDDCILTSLTGPDGVDYDDGTNIVVDPSFIQDVLMSLTPDGVNQIYTLRSAQAPGEGGNNVQVSIIPIVPLGDYHLRAGSPAIDQAAATAIPELVTDYDGEARPNPGGDDPTAGDIGADEFYAPEKLTLVTPNGGEVIPTGNPYTIFWQATANFTGTYRLQVSYDNGATWATIPGAESLSADTDTFVWDVPPQNGNMKQSLIRVQAFDGATKVGQDVSDGTFEVEVVKILYPSDAIVQFISGNTYAPPFGINWRLNDVKKTVAKARIEVSKNGGATWEKADISPDANAIISPTENTTLEHSWTVPNVGKGKTQAKVRVLLLDAAGNVIGKDQNDVTFTILPAL